MKSPMSQPSNESPSSVDPALDDRLMADLRLALEELREEEVKIRRELHTR